MSSIIGTIKINSLEVEWEITDYFNIDTSDRFQYYYSPDFSISPETWKFKLWEASAGSSKSVCFAVENAQEDKEHMKCTMGLKNVYGIAEYLPPMNFNPVNVRILKEELFRRKNELVPSNILTVVCTVTSSCDSRRECPLSDPKSDLPPLKLIRLDTLSQNFETLYGDKDSVDVTLQVKEKEFHAHKTILMARSSVFAAIFKHDLSEKQTGIVTITDCDPSSFHQFLEYLYCGKLENMSFPSALSLYGTADKYNVLELKSFCVDYMVQHMTEHNVCDVVILADLYDEAKLLFATQSFFNKNMVEIFAAAEWKNFLKNNLDLGNKLLMQMATRLINCSCLKK